MIEIRHLRKEFENAIPIKDISTTIKDGEVVALIGPSGTGKTTILRMLNMLIKPTSGQIFIDGEEITAPNYPLTKIRGKVAMVFQNFNLFNHMTNIENICYAPIKLKNVSPKAAYERGMELLTQMGLAHTAFKYPDEISGGQKQRVAIARTIAVDPEIILFDEPTSALDPTMVGEVEKVIQVLCTQGYTILLVTHDMAFAEKVATRVIFLSDGYICEDGTSEQIFRNPQNAKTKAFIKQLKQFECVINSDDNDFLGFYTKLDQYSLSNDIDSDMKRKIQSIFEEVCYQILIKKANESRLEDYEIVFSVDYSERDKDAEIIVKFRNIDVDIYDDEYKLQREIVAHYSKDTRVYDEDGAKVLRLVIE